MLRRDNTAAAGQSMLHENQLLRHLGNRAAVADDRKAIRKRAFGQMGRLPIYLPAAIVGRTSCSSQRVSTYDNLFRETPKMHTDFFRWLDQHKGRQYDL